MNLQCPLWVKSRHLQRKFIDARMLEPTFFEVRSSELTCAQLWAKSSTLPK